MRILDHLENKRKDELSGSTITRVKFLYDPDYFFYKILFIKGGVAYEKTIAVANKSRDI